MSELYEPKINSPITELASSITPSSTSVSLVDASVLPDGPNICTIGREESPETIKYTAKSGNTLTGVTRGFEGTAANWAAGTPVARVMTAYDLSSVQEHAEIGSTHANTPHAPSNANNYIHPTSVQCNPAILTPGTGLTGSNYDGKTARTWAVAYGTTAGTACQGNDGRLSDARTPTAHNHDTSNITSGTLSVARGGTGRSTITATHVPFGNDTNALGISPSFTFSLITGLNVNNVRGIDASGTTCGVRLPLRSKAEVESTAQVGDLFFGIGHSGFGGLRLTWCSGVSGSTRTFTGVGSGSYFTW